MGKKFKDTGIGRFLLKKVPGAIDKIGDVFPPAKIISELIDGEPDMTPQEKLEAQQLVKEYNLEYFELQVADRQSARQREVEIAKAGGKDYMMTVTGCVGLLAFLMMIYAVMFLDIKNEAIFHQLIGMVEGIAITMFAYYYGTSKQKEEPKD